MGIPQGLKHEKGNIIYYLSLDQSEGKLRNTILSLRGGSSYNGTHAYEAKEKISLEGLERWVSC